MIKSGSSSFEMEPQANPAATCRKGATVLMPVKGKPTLTRRWLAPPLTAPARGDLRAAGRVEGMAVIRRSKGCWRRR